MLHVVCHSLVKDVLFMGAGAVILKTGETQVDALRGIGKRMPVTMWCFAIGSLGLIGIPPCLGFFSKWELAQGSLAMTGVASWLNWFGPVVLLLSALLTAGYLMPIVLRGFFPGKDAQVGEKCEASASMPHSHAGADGAVGGAGHVPVAADRSFFSILTALL